MEWLYRLTPTKEPRCGVVVNAPRPYSGPLCSLLRRPVLCLGPFSATWPPSDGPPHPPPLPAPSFSSSS